MSARNEKGGTPSRLVSEMLETATEMHANGVMDEATYKKITMRHLGDERSPIAAPLTGAEIKALREQAHMSQTVFAKYLNLTVGYVSKLEREAERPTGPTLVLLNVIRRLGMSAIL